MNGWYYDKQLENPLTSVSLHPNQEIDKESGGWKNIDDKKGDDEHFYTSSKDDNTCGYRIEPIARAILQEDFNVAVANRWTPVGDNALSETWNRLRTIGPYTPVIKDVMGDIIDASKEKGDEAKKEGAPVTSKLSDVIAGVTSFARGGLNLLSSRINDSLIIQGSRFTYYTGSGVAFGNLGLRYTMFPIFDSNGRMKSTTEQIIDILPYVNGSFEESSVDAITGAIKGWMESDEGVAHLKTQLGNDMEKVTQFTKDTLYNVGKEIDKIRANRGKTDEKAKAAISSAETNIKKTIENIGIKNQEIKNIANDTINKVDEYFSGLVSWQKAPGGYKPSYKDIDAPQKGTLKLRIGTQYSISSLLCQDITMNFSKVMVKDPETHQLSPLYCDVNLTLSPATMYSNASLKKFIEGTKNISNKNTDHMENLRKQQEYLRKNYYVS